MGMRDAVGDDRALFVIGASAGGVDALEQLLSSLPSDFGAPIVIAQHLDPDAPSRLEQVLHDVSTLPLVTVKDGTQLQAGTVYLVPSGQHVEIKDSRLVASSKMRRARPQPSIDLLFQSASEAYGEHLVAVLLSGMGSDGAAGVRAVKEGGGTVVIQDPASAAYPSLPASIPPTQVDLIAPVERMGNLLAGLAARKHIPEALYEEEVLRAFLTQIRARAGIDFTQYKMPTIVRRLSRLMTGAQCTTLPDYMRYLNANPEAYQRLVGSFLIKVTGFFRDSAFFDYLREEVLPELIAHARETGSELRVWSAGCATGEEPYSIAILLAELLDDEIDDLHIRIFATDLDMDSIVFARRGIYSASSLSGMPPQLLQKYFVRLDDSYQVKKRIRNLTVFGEYDLGQRAPFPRIDLVLCRNVLIYFTKELQQRTLQLFAFSLREGGYLVLGKSESVSPLPQYFASANPVLKVFRRHGDRLFIPPPASFVTGMPVPERPSVRRGALKSIGLPRRSIEPSMRLSMSERLGSVLYDSPEGVVIVDRNYDIMWINQAARSMLGIHGQAVGDDLIHLASALPNGSLKATLDAAFRGEPSTDPCEFEVRDAAEETRFLQITSFADKAGSNDGRVTGVILMLRDTTEECTRRKRLEAENRERLQTNERLSKQNEELQQRARSLMAANAELSAAHNELLDSNEHLLIAAEEAEASAEEVETLNEEMQATSEELETLNEELQATVEELNTTNEELGARSDELEKLALERQDQLRRSEEERHMYESAIAQMPAAVAIVSPEGRVLCVSNAYRDLARRMRTLRDVGETFVEPSAAEATVRTVNVDIGEKAGRVLFITPV